MLPPFAETYSTIGTLASFCRDIFYYWNTCLLLQRHILLLEHLPPFAETYFTIGTLASFAETYSTIGTLASFCRDIFYYWNTHIEPVL